MKYEKYTIRVMRAVFSFYALIPILYTRAPKPIDQFGVLLQP